MHVSEPLVPAQEDIGLLCLIVANGFTDRVLKLLSDAGFGDTRFAHGFIVQGLLAGDTTVTGLADRLGVTAQAVSKTVKEMERMGYVEKLADSRDRRSARLALTVRAQASIAASRQARKEVQERLLAVLGPGAGPALEYLQCLAAEFGGLDALADRRVRPIA